METKTMSPDVETKPLEKRRAQMTLRAVRASRPTLSAARLIQSTARARRLGKWLLAAMVVLMIAALALPWWQTARGTGRVISYNPFEREQTVKSPAEGIVIRVNQELREGMSVKTGDFIAEIQPKAATLLEQLRSQINDLTRKLETANVKAENYSSMVRELEDNRDFAVKAADEMVAATQAKLRSKQASIAEYQQKVIAAEFEFKMTDNLTRPGVGVKSQNELQKAKANLAAAEAKLLSGREEVNEATKELSAKESERDAKRSEAQSKVEKANGDYQAALGEAAKEQKEIRDLELKLEEQERLIITAPCDGKIQGLTVYPLSQAIKEGDELLTIVPELTQRAVELAVDGNDLPFVEVNDEVRLQFEGWPALQFSGWPSVAVGTFAGRVAQINPTDDGKGTFRVVIIPDLKDDHPRRLETPDHWPDDTILRQGVRVNGWVVLGRVSLGYEVWRQLNGFPPVLQSAGYGSADKSSDKAPKTPKLPK
jgi:multidrug resistance efflux pump